MENMKMHYQYKKYKESTELMKADLEKLVEDESTLNKYITDEELKDF